MRNLFGKYLKDWRVWTGVGVVAGAIAIIPFLKGAYAALLGGILAAAALGAGAARWIKRRARSTKSTKFKKMLLSSPTPPVADRGFSIKDLRAKFEAALEKLKGAGPDYLYRVPWFLLVGEPAAGKTVTVMNSRLDLINKDKTKGIAGTLNCDWWFTNQGVILDTAGRYVFSDDEAPDRSEWDSFLGLLSWFRPRQPLNGIVLAIPMVRTVKGAPDIPLLLPPADPKAREECFERAGADAERLYQKIGQLPARLGVRFPIYVLITKCDKVPGFQEFFTQAQQQYQNQLLGWANPDLESEYSSNMVDRAFDAIEGSLERVRLEIMAQERPLAFADEVFVFPEEFKRLREPVRRYTDVLFRKNIYQEPLFFRGIFFSSGLQDQRPLEGLLGQAAVPQGEKEVPQGAGAVGESTIAFSRGAGPLFESKPYFIHDFYSEKVFPESGLVRPTRAIWEQIVRRTKALRAAALLIGIGGLIAFSFYVATMIKASHELKTAVEPLVAEVENPRSGQWGKVSREAGEAIATAGRYDASVLRWLNLDPLTSDVRDKALKCVNKLALIPLADKFLQGFLAKIEERIGDEGLTANETDFSQAKLVKLIGDWQKEAARYRSVVTGEDGEKKLKNRERVLRLWEVAVGGKLPEELETFLARHGEEPEIAGFLRALPSLEKRLSSAQEDLPSGRLLPSTREGLRAKLDKLDQDVKLKVEAMVEGLRRVATSVGTLNREKDSAFEVRRKALSALVEAWEKIRKEIPVQQAGAKSLEAQFAEDIEARRKMMEEVIAGSFPLLEAPSEGLLDRALEAAKKLKVAEKVAGKAAEKLVEKDQPQEKPGLDERASSRWKAIQEVLDGKDLFLSGIGPPPGKEVFLLAREEAQPPAGGKPAGKVLWALGREAWEFFREVDSVKDLQFEVDAGATGSDHEKEAKKVSEAIESLLSDSFYARGLHLDLVRQVRGILGGASPRAAGSAEEGSKPPVTRSLVQIVKDLVRRQVGAALYRFLVASPEPADQKGQELEFGSDPEAEFLKRIEWGEWIQAGETERDSVERLQVRHALNRLKTKRQDLDTKPILLMDKEKVRAWQFEPFGKVNNLQKYFLNSTYPDTGSYFNNELRKLKLEYADKFEASKCLEILEPAPKEPSREPFYSFWKETAAQVRGAPEAQSRREVFIKFIEAITELRGNDAVPFFSLTDFIEVWKSKAPPDGDKSFLDLRQLEITNAVIGRIQEFLALKFQEEFEKQFEGIHKAVQGRFPVSLEAIAAGKDPKEYYAPLSEELVASDEFFRRWGLAPGESAGDEGKKRPRPLHEYFREKFQKGYGVDLAADYKAFLDFLRENFFREKYGIQIEVLNHDETKRGILGDDVQPEVLEANRLLRELKFKAGETTEVDLGREPVGLVWVNPQPLQLKARLYREAGQYKIRRPGDASFDSEARYEFPTDWAFFRMLLDHDLGLDKEKSANVVKFDFEVNIPISAKGGEIKKLPVYLLMRMKRATPSEGGAVGQYRRFEIQKLRDLYKKVREPKLRL